MKIGIQTEKAPKPVGPYSQAVQFNDLLFISGQLALDPETGLIFNGTVTDKVNLIFSYIQEILSESGYSLDNILKVDIFLSDMDDFPELNRAYANIFTCPVLPARCVVEVNRLPKDADLEISCIAGIDLLTK